MGWNPSANYRDNLAEMLQWEGSGVIRNGEQRRIICCGMTRISDRKKLEERDLMSRSRTGCHHDIKHLTGYTTLLFV